MENSLFMGGHPRHLRPLLACLFLVVCEGGERGSSTFQTPITFERGCTTSRTTLRLMT